MNLDQIKRLAALAVETEDKTLADIALKAIADFVIEAPAPVAKKPNIDDIMTPAIAIRSLIGTWKRSGYRGNMNTTELTDRVLRHIPESELQLIFPGYQNRLDGWLRGKILEDNIKNINCVLHSDEIVLTKNGGRYWKLRKKPGMAI